MTLHGNTRGLIYTYVYQLLYADGNEVVRVIIAPTNCPGRLKSDIQTHVHVLSSEVLLDAAI